MAEVTADDVVLSVWRDQDPTAITLVQPGARLFGAALLTTSWIYALATVTVRGIPGEDVGLWRFGFIQLKFITDDWLHYRNADRTEGSVFVAMDRPPSRPQQLCRDFRGKWWEIGRLLQRSPFMGPLIFYDYEAPLTGLWGVEAAGFLPKGTRIPAGGALLFTILFSDSPKRGYDLVRVNVKRQMPNDLYSLQNGAAFVTIFAAQKGPNQPIVMLKSFQWNVRWRAHFGRQGGLIVQLPPRTGDVMDMNISHVVKGTPNDVRFQHSVLDTRLPYCNPVHEKAFDNPVVHESKKWEDWEVRH
jgi:hypothetical protein